jgi:large repetitive protein
VLRRLLAVATALALAVGAASVIALPAQAVQAPVAFNAKALPTWQTNGVAYKVAQAHGLVFVGGTFTSIRPPGAVAGTGEVARSNFAVLDAATGAPTSCAPEFTVGNPGVPEGATVRSLSVSPDQNTLYVGGFFSRVSGSTAQHLAAIDIASCSLITNFKPLPNSTVHTIVSTSSTVYFGGGFITAGTAAESRRKAAAATAVGTPTPGALLPWNPVFDLDVLALTLNPGDGSVVVAGGNFDVVNGASSHALVILNSTSGANVRTYAGGFIHTNSVVKDLTSDATGFYTGNEGTGGGVFDGRIALNWSDYNQRWRDTCLGATQAVVVFQTVLYSASHAHDCASMGSFPDGERQHFLAQSVNDPTLLGWFPDTNEGTGEGIGPRGMVVASSGAANYMWSVGEFTSVNGVRQQGMTRFGQGPGSASPSSPTTSVSSVRPGQAQVSWRTSLDLDDATLTYNVYRDNNPNPIHTATATSWFWNRPQLSFTDTNQLLGSTHTYRVGVTDGDNTVYTPWRSVTIASTVSSYAERVTADGAKMLWRFDEASDTFFSDYTGSGNSGTLLGSATYQVAPGAVANDPSRAIGVAGASTIHTGNVAPSPNQFTVETWFKTTSTTGGKLIGFGNRQTDNSGSYDKHVYMQNNGRLSFGVYTGSTVTIASPNAYNDGQWHHVAASQGPEGMALYVDGSRVARGSTTTNENFSGYWRVGGDNLNAWPNRPTSDYFDGNLDETAVYPTALTAATVAEHYVLAGGTLGAGNTGPTDTYGRTVFADDPTQYWRLAESSGTVAADSGAEGVTGRYFSGVTRNQTGAVDGTTNAAVRLSGTSTGLISSSNQIAPPSAFSTELWFKTTSTSGGKLIGFGNAQSGNSSTYDRQVYLTNDGRLIFGTNGSGLSTITSPATYRDGSYHHVVATQGASGMALYVDGVLVGTHAATTGENNNGYWRVGGDRVTSWPEAPSSSYVNGTVDEVSIYSKALSAAKVAAHYSAGKTSVPDAAPPTTPKGLTVGMTAGSAQLAWQSSIDNVGVTGYQVHRSTTLGFTPSAATLVDTTAGTTFTDTNAPAGSVYYRVLARDAAGNLSDPSMQYSVYVPDVVAPSTPTGVTVTTTSNSAALSWDTATDNLGVAEYDVYRSATAGFTPGPANLLLSTTSTNIVDSPLGLGTWYYRVKAKDTASNLSASSAEVSGVVADTAAPTAASDVTTAVAGSTVQVSWTAAIDDVGSPSYRVYRSATSGFTPGAATLVGTSSSTELADGPVNSGIWYYRVVSFDAAGNTGPASAEVQTVVAPAPSSAPINPIADTYANQGATGTNYGTTTSLASRGNIGATSYLRFVLPTPVSGRTLTSAVLQVRTTADSFAGSLEPHTVSLAGNGWTETGLTWNNRPALTGGAIGTIAGGSSPNAVLTTALNASALQAAGSGEVTLAVTNAGTDNLWFASRNHANAAYRPVLTLTYSEADTAAPLTPSGAAATVDGYTADLTWNVPLDNVGVTGYDVYRSSTTGFVPGPGNLIGSPTAAAFEDSTLSAGTWYYRVVAKDAAGNRSNASNQLTVVVADSTAPSVPTGFAVEGTPTSVSLSWTASTDNVAGPIEYDVHRSQTAGFVAGPGNLVTTIDEPTYEDSPLSLGTWYYRVVAKDAAGNASAASAQVTAVVADTTAPTVPTGISAAVDGSNVTVTWEASGDDVAVAGYDVYRSATAGFTPAPANLHDSASGTQYVDASTPAGTWHYRVVAKDSAGNRSQPSAEVSAVVVDTTAPSAVSDLDTTVTGASVKLAWTAATDNGAVASYAVHRSATAGFTPGAGTLRGTTADTTFVDEPVTTGTWYYRVIATDTAGNVGAASDEVSAVVSDVTAPTAPTGVGAAANGSTISVTWTASTDAVGVVGYDVYRSATSGFTPSPATLVGSPTGTAFQDTGVGSGTWYYRVIAKDAAGNRSNDSAQTSALVAPGSPVVTPLAPIADTYANRGAATTNYGSTASLASRGSVGAVSYLRFALPAAPAGTVLTGASLQIRTTADSFAGSAEAHQVTLAGNTWDEGTLNWNNRPALTGGTIGTFAAGTNPSSVYSTAIDVAALTDAVGGQVTLGVTNNGIDNLWFWSRNHPTAGYRPQLALTYGPDTTAPSAATALSASAAAGDVDLAWSAATDNAGVVGYDVYRSSSAGFTPGASSWIGAVSGLTYKDVSHAAGTWYYRVVARDGSGNRGPATAAAVGTVA